MMSNLRFPTAARKGPLEIGVILGDVHGDLSPRERLDGLLRQVEAAQRNGLAYVTIGQHYLYGDQRWLQPIPTLARLAAELERRTSPSAPRSSRCRCSTRSALAEELATLDILTRGRLVVGTGAGYREDEFTAFGVDYGQRLRDVRRGDGDDEAAVDRGRREVRGQVLVVQDGPDAHPPWQRAPPPMWIGAMKGARRAALGATRRRLGGDPGDEGAGAGPAAGGVRGRARAGSVGRRGAPAAPGDHPGRTTEEAYDRFEAMAKERLLAYAERRWPPGTRRDRARVPGGGRQETYIGTPDECVAQIAALAAVVPIDPMLVRAQWPHMTGDQVVAYLDDLGRDIVPAVRGHQVSGPRGPDAHRWLRRERSDPRWLRCGENTATSLETS